VEVVQPGADAHPLAAKVTALALLMDAAN